MAVPKCKICGAEAIWAWQPFGPGDDPDVLACLGWHYRGFPVVKICDCCAGKIKAGGPVDFDYGMERWRYYDGKMIRSTMGKFPALEEV